VDICSTIRSDKMKGNVKIELKKPIKCEQCGEIIMWDTVFSVAFYDEELVEKLYEKFDFTEETRLGYDTTELTLNDLKEIYNWKRLGLKNSDFFDVLQDMIKNLEDGNENKAVITIEDIDSFLPNDSKRADNIVAAIMTLVVSSFLVTNVTAERVTEKLNFITAMGIITQVLILAVVLFLSSMVINLTKAQKEVSMYLMMPLECKKCGYHLSIYPKSVDVANVIVNSKALRKSGIQNVRYGLSVCDINRLYENVKKYVPQYIGSKTYTLVTIERFITAMENDKSLSVKLRVTK